MRVPYHTLTLHPGVSHRRTILRLTMHTHAVHGPGLPPLCPTACLGRARASGAAPGPARPGPPPAAPPGLTFPPGTARRRHAAASGRAAPRFYIVAADFAAAFNRVDPERALGLAEGLLRAPEYVVTKHDEARTTPNPQT